MHPSFSSLGCIFIQTTSNFLPIETASRRLDSFSFLFSNGWEKNGLFEFFKAKLKFIKDKPRNIAAVVRSPSPPPVAKQPPSSQRGDPPQRSPQRRLPSFCSHQLIHSVFLEFVIILVIVLYLYRLNLFSKCCNQSRTCLNYTKLYILYVAMRKKDESKGK